ncbi:MAG: glycosyltransferase family 39 protein [Anaerolineae bacterium]|nr:glycosyltransferase family 39 protein [Anaerolineae bacterium]
MSSGGGLASLGTQWPPLYPLVLALFGDDPLVGARLLNVILFAANGVLFGAIAGPVSGNRWLSFAGSLLLLTATPIVTVHAYVWSEALFLWLGFLGLLILTQYLQRTEGRLLVVAAALLALAALTRYAGLPFIVTGMLAIVLLTEAPLTQRIRTSGLFGLTSALPLLLWLGWSFFHSGTAGNRVLAFHPIGRAQIWQAIFTVTGWLHLPPGTPGLFRILLLAILFTATVVGVNIWWRRHEMATVPAARTPFIWLALMFVPIYLGFLALTISFLDANTPLDDRIFVPLYFVVLLVVIAAVGIAIQQATQRLARWLLIATLGVMMLLQFDSAASWVQMHRQIGLGYSSPAWQQSQTVSAVRGLPDDAIIFSNAPEAIDLLAQREALSLPRKNAAMLGEANAGYDDEIAALKAAVDSGAVIVHFDAVADRPVTSPGELAEEMLLSVVQRTEDGVIFGAGRTQ